MSILKCGGKILKSIFKIEQHEDQVGEKGYLQMLTVDRSKNEIVHIIHEFSTDENRGCFMECCSLEGASKIYNLASQHPLWEKVDIFNEVPEVYKVVNYKNDEKPWFFSETDKFVLGDTFV